MSNPASCLELQQPAHSVYCPQVRVKCSGCGTVVPSYEAVRGSCCEFGFRDFSYMNPVDDSNRDVCWCVPTEPLVSVFDDQPLQLKRGRAGAVRQQARRQARRRAGRQARRQARGEAMRRSIKRQCGGPLKTFSKITSPQTSRPQEAVIPRQGSPQLFNAQVRGQRFITTALKSMFVGRR